VKPFTTPVPTSKANKVNTTAKAIYFVSYLESISNVLGYLPPLVSNRFRTLYLGASSGDGKAPAAEFMSDTLNLGFKDTCVRYPFSIVANDARDFSTSLDKRICRAQELADSSYGIIYSDVYTNKPEPFFRWLEGYCNKNLVKGGCLCFKVTAMSGHALDLSNFANVFAYAPNPNLSSEVILMRRIQAWFGELRYACNVQ